MGLLIYSKEVLNGTPYILYRSILWDTLYTLKKYFMGHPIYLKKYLWDTLYILKKYVIGHPIYSKEEFYGTPYIL